MGAEAQFGQYQTPKGLLKLIIFDYPTPSMAREQAAVFQKIPGAVVKRTGPLVVATVNPPDPDAAHRALSRIIGVCATRQGQDQTRAKCAGNYRSLCHLAPSPQAF